MPVDIDRDFHAGMPKLLRDVLHRRMVFIELDGGITVP
jgi:hypothetical protein